MAYILFFVFFILFPICGFSTPVLSMVKTIWHERTCCMDGKWEREEKCKSYCRIKRMQTFRQQFHCWWPI